RAGCAHQTQRLHEEGAVSHRSGGVGRCGACAFSASVLPVRSLPSVSSDQPHQGQAGSYFAVATTRTCTGMLSDTHSPLASEPLPMPHAVRLSVTLPSMVAVSPLMF